MLYFKISKKIKAIKYTNKNNNNSLKLLIENHKTNNNYITLNINEKEIKKMNEILKL